MCVYDFCSCWINSRLSVSQAQPLSTDHFLHQPSPPVVHLLLGAQRQDLLWTPPLPLERHSTPLQPLVHPLSPLGLAHLPMPSTAVRIPSAHPHRSPPDQPVSHPAFPGMTSFSNMLFSMFHKNMFQFNLNLLFQQHLIILSNVSLLLFSQHFPSLIFLKVLFFKFFVSSFSLAVPASCVSSPRVVWLHCCHLVSTSHSLFSIFSPCCSRRPPGAPSHRPTIIRPAEPSLLD